MNDSIYLFNIPTIPAARPGADEKQILKTRMIGFPISFAGNSNWEASQLRVEETIGFHSI